MQTDTIASGMPRRIASVIFVVLAVVGCIMVYNLDPEQTRWLPRCVFHSLTGYDCPTCGSTRALHHILHGHVIEGLRYNPFIVISLPMLVGVLYSSLFDNALALRFGKFFQNYITLLIFAALFIAWWIIRNI